MIMKAQREENKKDRYIEVTGALLDANLSEMGLNDKIGYAESLKEVLENMDFQIYELYRALQDRFVLTLKEIFEASKTNVYSEYLSSADWKGRS